LNASRLRQYLQQPRFPVSSGEAYMKIHPNNLQAGKVYILRVPSVPHDIYFLVVCTCIDSAEVQGSKISFDALGMIQHRFTDDGRIIDSKWVMNEPKSISIHNAELADRYELYLPRTHGGSRRTRRYRKRSVHTRKKPFAK
jgi:hypothetical protein